MMNIVFQLRPTVAAQLLMVAVVILVGAPPVHAESFTIKDKELQICVQELAQKNQWNRPTEVTEIKCHSKGIQSMAGLEQFKNLQSLSLYNNKLQQVDIELTSLPRLTHLNLARNNVTQLTIADVPHISKLYIFDNRLENLTLSNLPELNVFKANNNSIEDFTYSQLPRLEKVYIFNNKLETINIYDLPKLQYMDCRQNPMPDSLYDEMDKKNDVTFHHDGNAEDW